MNVSFILLPDSICVDILSAWICESMLLKIDSAYCNFKSRNLFRDIISSPQFSINGDRLLARLHCIEWVVLRKVKVRSVKFSRFECNEKAFVNKLDMSRVERIVLGEYSDEMLSDENAITLISSCRRLKSFHCRSDVDYLDTLFNNISRDVLAQLTDLYLCDTDDNNSFQPQLTQYCTNLSRLSLGSTWDTDISKFITVNHNLTSLTLCGINSLSVDFVKEVNEHCPHLSTLILYRLTSFNIDAMEYCLLNYENLTHAVFKHFHETDYIKYTYSDNKRILKYCEGIYGVELLHFFEVVNNFHEIEIHNVVTHSPQLYQLISEKSPNLMILTVRDKFPFHSENLVYNTLKTFLQTCKKLISVTLVNTLTFNSLLQLFHESVVKHRLKFLSISNHGLFDINLVNLLKLQNPNTMILYDSNVNMLDYADDCYNSEVRR